MRQSGRGRPKPFTPRASYQQAAITTKTARNELQGGDISRYSLGHYGSSLPLSQLVANTPRSSLRFHVLQQLQMAYGLCSCYVRTKRAPRDTRSHRCGPKRHLAAPKLVACNDPHIPPLPDSGDASAKPSIVVARSCEANFRHFQPAQARSATDTTDFWELTVG